MPTTIRLRAHRRIQQESDAGSNRELGSHFNLQLFRHRARWNEASSRIEMHLESLITQVVFVPAIDLLF